MMQVGVHPPENKWILVFWLLLFCDLHSTKQSKAKNTKLTSSPTKMQQPDAAVNNRDTMCITVTILGLIQRVTQQRILTGTKIGLVNMNSCKFSNIIQDDRNYIFEIYSLFERKVLSS
jgi:hypothetical protein